MPVWMILTPLSSMPVEPSGSRRKAGTSGPARPAHGKDGIKEGANRKQRCLWNPDQQQGSAVFCELGTNKMGKIDPRPWGSQSTNCQRELGRAAWRSRQTTRSISRTSGGNLGARSTTGAVKMWASPGGHNSGPYASRLRQMGWSGTANRE